jgi:hypothetical protein
MNPVESLENVLCSPDGKCCIAGSEEEDRHIIDRALTALKQQTVSTEHGPWLESKHPGEEGESYCKRCLLRFKFLGARSCTPHIVEATAARQAADVIESLQAEVERLKAAAKYAEHIDATPDNQRETMLHDALTERNALRTQIKSARRDALEEAAKLCCTLHSNDQTNILYAAKAIRKLKDET